MCRPRRLNLELSSEDAQRDARSPKVERSSTRRRATPTATTRRLHRSRGPALHWYRLQGNVNHLLMWG
ncbi:hypothetical protein EYF80_053303 [Liparis tanakae]|uniref:Uncharacterized protein n=1 Tax=Liparis tanakae TaxID=230148 RepID=A0A4Z2F5L1_9TELE|nr:hypothetical protein EYF80_053303 [Liparis tanakae]